MLGARTGHAAQRRRFARDRRLFADRRRSRAHLGRGAALDGAVDGEPSRLSGARLLSLQSRLSIVDRNARHAARCGNVADDDGRRRARRAKPASSTTSDATQRTIFRATFSASPREADVGHRALRVRYTPASGSPRRASGCTSVTTHGSAFRPCARVTRRTSTRSRASSKSLRCNGRRPRPRDRHAAPGGDRELKNPWVASALWRKVLASSIGTRSRCSVRIRNASRRVRKFRRYP